MATAHALERTPSSVTLTAEALRLLDDPRDDARETTMSMLEHDMWNAFQTDEMDALDDACDRMSVQEEEAAAGGKRHSRVSGNSAFDAVGGSFVAYLAPRFGPSSSSRPAKLLMRTLAQELDCAASRDVGSRGSVALESSGVQLHEHEDVAVLFVGELENKAELAEDLPGPTPARHLTCAELIHRLYADSGPAFVSQLVGFFSFVVVDAEAAVVLAAVDRHASFPLVKGRCASGGVFIAHAAGSNGAGALRHNLGEAMRVPAGSYLHGNRHMHPHRYARCAEAERALEEMDATSERLRRNSAAVSDATLGGFDQWHSHSRSQSPGESLRGGNRWNASEGHLDQLEDAARAAVAARREHQNPRASRVASDRSDGSRSRRDSIRHDCDFDMGALRSWGATDRRRRGGGGGDDEDDAEMEEWLQEPESRMGFTFHARRDDFVPRIGSGASTSTVARDDASGSSAHGDGEHAYGHGHGHGHAYAHAHHGISNQARGRGEDKTEDVLRRHLAELMARREEARRAADATPASETTKWSMKVNTFAADRGFEADDAIDGDESECFVRLGSS